MENYIYKSRKIYKYSIEIKVMIAYTRALLIQIANFWLKIIGPQAAGVTCAFASTTFHVVVFCIRCCQKGRNLIDEKISD